MEVRMDCKASVIIPVYNAENGIVRCVESIIYGIYKDIEVILVEDCSNDNSWRICQQLADQYANVLCFQNEKNSGVSFTRNRGLKEARGKYILFVDSDDWVSGRYAEMLIHAAEENANSLVICGCHFHENVAGYKRNYIWKENGSATYIIERKNFFELSKRFHLQQLWNKVFLRKIIETNNICFDESQSMGEDCQFVLDYMEAAQTQQCVIINEPLYYYIRANATSLMSKFGLTENDNEYNRLEQLLRLSGTENPENHKCFMDAVQVAKNNSVYQAVHANSFSKEEKLIFIERVMQDGQAEKYYREQSITKKKEQLVALYHKIKDLPTRMYVRLQREKNKRLIGRMRKKLKVKDVTIISQNCIGGVFYHDMAKNFLSPTINLFIREPDFVKFVLNLRYYIDSELEVIWGEEYPIGILGGDVHIDFMHYRSCTDALEAWERRKKRILWDKIVVLATDRNGFTDNVFEQWKKIPYPKVLFCANKDFLQESGTIFYPQYAKQSFVPDLIPKREFYKEDVLLNVVNYMNM